MYKGGLFSPPVICAVGDPYVDPSKRDQRGHGMSKGHRQFGIGKGIPGQFNRLYEGEKHKSLHKLAAEDRIKDRKGFLTPNGFAHTSPIKKSASTGDFYGTFNRKPFPYISDGTYGERGSRKAFGEFKGRKIYTAPSKKATGDGACQGTTPQLLFQEFPYIESPYDAERKADAARNEQLRTKFEGKPAFKVPKHEVLKDILAEESADHPPSPVQTKELAVSPIATLEHKAFRPSSPPKAGPLGTLNKYPEHVNDPFDDKAIRTAQMSSRLLPMLEQVEGLSEKLRERKAWQPSSPPKSMFVKPLMVLS